MAINSKNEICNMGISLLGSYDPVQNIDTPVSSVELVCALWYDITRQSLLKEVMPNFALARRVVSQTDDDPDFGFEYVYEYPSDCLKVLGIGNIKDKENNYTVENGKIYAEIDYENGLELRFIRDVTDVTTFSPEFKILLAKAVAANIAMPLTQDLQKAQMAMQLLPAAMSAATSLNAQENRPIRISHSRYRTARYGSSEQVKR